MFTLVGAEDLLDDLSSVRLALECSGSLLLDPVDAARLSKQLYKCFSGGILNLECIRSFTDRKTVFLGQFYEHATRLGRYRIIVLPPVYVDFLWVGGIVPSRLGLNWYSRFTHF